MSAISARMRFGGVAGIIAAPLLVLETSCFLLSGWTAQKFADPQQAMDLLRTGGADLRLAAVFGFAGLIVTACLLIGLAARAREHHAGVGDAILYLGLIGVAGHSLVPLGLWIGIPMFLAAAAHNGDLAVKSWEAFAATSNAAEGVGSVFLGASTLLVALAAFLRRSFSFTLGAIAAVCGALDLIILCSIGTSFMAAASVLFMPSLAATVLFRLWAGLELYRLSAMPGVSSAQESA